jgi:hypothetical protein
MFHANSIVRCHAARRDYGRTLGRPSTRADRRRKRSPVRAEQSRGAGPQVDVWEVSCQRSREAASTRRDAACEMVMSRLGEGSDCGRGRGPDNEHLACHPEENQGQVEECARVA